MRPIIKKLGHLGIAAVFSLVVVIGLSTCGGKQKRQPGSLPEEAAAPAEGAAAKGEATKGEEVMGTNPTVNYGDDTGVAGQEDFSIFQLAGAGPWASYDSSAARINNVDVAAASLMASPREVVEKASECKSPGRVAASGSVIAVCVGETKVLWAGSDDFVIKADSEMPIAVLSKPEFMKSFVGSRDDSEKFSGAMSAEKGNTLVLLGYESFKRVSQPGAGGGSGGVVTPPATANPAMGQIVHNIGSVTTTPPGGSQQTITTQPPSGGGGVVTCTAIGCQQPSPGQGSGSTPDQPNDVVVNGLLTASTLGIYFTDFSIISEISQPTKGVDLATRRALYGGFPAGPDAMDTYFGKLGFLKLGQDFDVIPMDDNSPVRSCDALPATSVFGIKLYHLFLEIPAKEHCESIDYGIKIKFPALALSENVSGRTLKDHGVSFFKEVSAVAQDGKVTMGMNGWRLLSHHKARPEYDRLHTSLELLVAPALESMEGLASQKIYAAHLFITLDPHVSGSATDMKGKPFKLTPTNITLGVFPLGRVAPFHTLVIRPHLLHLDMKHQKMEFAWPMGTEYKHSPDEFPKFEVPLFLDAQSKNPVAELNQMSDSDNAGSCGFDVLFSPVGNEAFQVILAVVKMLTPGGRWPVDTSFYIETLFDLQAVTYAKNADSCIVESAVEMTTGAEGIVGVKELTQEFNIISGPKLILDVTASKRKVVASPAPSPWDKGSSP